MFISVKRNAAVIFGISVNTDNQNINFHIEHHFYSLYHFLKFQCNFVMLTRNNLSHSAFYAALQYHIPIVLTLYGTFQTLHDLILLFF